jgi:hypothetical protein
MSLGEGIFRAVHRRRRRVKVQQYDSKRRTCIICGQWNYLPENAATGRSEVQILTDDDGNKYPSVSAGAGCRFCGSGNWV